MSIVRGAVDGVRQLVVGGNLVSVPVGDCPVLTGLGLGDEEASTDIAAMLVVGPAVGNRRHS